MVIDTDSGTFLKGKVNKGPTFFKHTQLIIIENPEDPRKIEGPNFYIIPANDSVYKNDEAILINEFTINSYSAPRNRCLFKFDIISNSNDPSNLRKTYLIFIENYLKRNPSHTVIYELGLSNEITANDFESENHNDHIIITRNDHKSFDLDFYYVTDC